MRKDIDVYKRQKQSNVDSQELSTAAGIPEAQLKYVDNSPSGTGIIKYGNTCIRCV